jgi:type I restriction enzyme S subunit
VVEQERIVEALARRLARLDLLDRKTKQSIVLLKERRSALITAAVTGKIDLRESA